MQQRISALVPFLLLGLAACGGGSNDSTGSGGSGSGGAGNQIDACAIVTQEDATQLFGQPASPQEGTLNVDPNLLGECLWTWDTATDNQLLQFRIWNGTNYYGAPSDSTPYSIGDQGYVRTHPVAGVDVGWTQGNYSVFLSYSTIGQNVPNATTKESEVEALAQKASSGLAGK